MARVTVRAIAEASGLSAFTVSRALSGKGGVSEATRRVVRDLADSMGWRGQAAADGDVGLVFHDQDPVNADLQVQIQNGVQREAQRWGLSVRIHWGHDPGQIRRFAKASRGILMVGPHAPETMRGVIDEGSPLVRMGWLDPLEPIDHVSGTNREAGQAVGRFLVGLGHRHIGYVQGRTGLRGREERLRGLRDVAEATPGMEIRNLCFEDQGLWEVLEREMRGGFAPTALFCAHDALAVQTIPVLMRQGFRIPEDISVVGFSDFPVATQISPPLTTVRVHGAEIGAAALRLLLDRLEGRLPPGSPARRVQIVETLVVRGSTGPAPTGRRKARR
jgi:LacI family transcriptional regulator